MNKMYRSFDAYDQFPIEKSALTPVVPTSNRSFKYSQYIYIHNISLQNKSNYFKFIVDVKTSEA